MTRFFLYLTLVIWPFGHLLSIRIESLPFQIYYLDIVVILLSVSLLFDFKKIKHLLSSPLIKAQGILFAALIFSYLVNIDSIIKTGNIVTVLYLLRILVYPAIYLAAQTVNKIELKKVVAFSVTIFMMLGGIQYLLLPDLRVFKYLGYDDHYYRLAGTLLDPNFTGAIIAATALYLLFSKYIYHSIICIVLLALTFSRASYLSFILSFIAGYFMHKKASWKMLTILPLLGLFIYFAPKPFGEGVNLLRSYSITSRFQSWENGIKLFSVNPLIGSGSNYLNKSRIAIDNSYIYLLAISGIIGFLSLINLLKIALTSQPTQNKVFIFAILVHSFFNNSLFYIWILSAFWLVLALDSME